MRSPCPRRLLPPRRSSLGWRAPTVILRAANGAASNPNMRLPIFCRRSALHLLQFIPIWLLLKASSVLPAELRFRVWAALGGCLVRSVPALGTRVRENLGHVMPELSKDDQTRLAISIGSNVGGTLSEMLFNRQFGEALPRMDVSGPGIDAVLAARGKGCILVSGHFGQFEAVRHVLKARGLPSACIYKPNTNRYYDAVFLENLRRGGEPVFESGSRGMREIVRHLGRGGFVSILVDQRYNKGEVLDFLGRPAFTSTVAADLALKFAVPLVPAYGTRLPGGRIAVEFELPVEHTSATEMTQKINDSIAKRVREHPEQWYWLHRRWKHVPRNGLPDQD